ncbi:MAG: UDP-glucose/GDP-mannose dehydrogenase family protein [Candidatus Kerfeldbacteria bacterium]|nr:UDP-glucose/GDP-mannose dehydrogenase family protein [Candidatus Kerfeldbacteria bacterium]
MHLTVVGTGYVGLVTGTCLADAGHSVTCIDIDQEKISRLNKGDIPIYEPGLEQLVKHNVAAGRLKFTTSLAEALPATEVLFIAVGTPSAADGRADLRYVFTVADDIGKHLDHYIVVVDKSTVPVGTAKQVTERIQRHYQGDFDVASCPEFLREGSAVDDFFAPDRIVLGVRNDKAGDILLDVFKTIKGQKVLTTIESAELIKYASNAFLATKISFINEIAQICERSGADIEEVAYGIGLDNRIGPKFLKAGIGWGGSCFPKDVIALDQMAGDGGYDFRLLKAVVEVNSNQRGHFIKRISDQLGGTLAGKTLAAFGLAFKNNTDDIRESAAIDIIEQLIAAGATVKAFDYKATDNARAALPTSVLYPADPYETARQADALLVLTEWKEFKELDWIKLKSLLRQPVVFDGRNLLKPATMRELGYSYYSIGR